MLADAKMVAPADDGLEPPEACPALVSVAVGAAAPPGTVTQRTFSLRVTVNRTVTVCPDCVRMKGLWGMERGNRNKANVSTRGWGRKNRYVLMYRKWQHPTKQLFNAPCRRTLKDAQRIRSCTSRACYRVRPPQWRSTRPIARQRSNFRSEH